ncbi:acyltransferase family protein [Ideonella oryzae]|uniref:Acyltransferase n=1 Tax=Ideonella oryzae TaxID=2937441 RepID=A0ABT1BS16_9BURK|nr:acyltransferase [Ideonella oryzae]
MLTLLFCQTTMKRNQALDGLRAVAVLMVMGDHAVLPHFAGGFIGVDIFFVLSGFLISGVVMDEWLRAGGFNFRRFLYRRFLRLFPALFLMALLVLPVAAAMSGSIEDAALDAGAALLYITNLVRLYALHEPNLFYGHTWSLGVEQQFYLLWPLGLMVCFRNALGVRAILKLSLLLLLALLAWRLHLALSQAPLPRLYNAPDTRLQGVLLGCLAGMALRGLDAAAIQRLSRAGALLRWPMVGVAMAVFLSVRIDTGYFTWGLPLIEAVACLLILDLHLRPETRLAKALAWRPVARLGVVSYGVYLWHYPIFRVLDELVCARSAFIFLVGGALSVLIAELSFRFWETPILDRQRSTASASALARP